MSDVAYALVLGLTILAAVNLLASWVEPEKQEPPPPPTPVPPKRTKHPLDIEKLRHAMREQYGDSVCPVCASIDSLWCAHCNGDYRAE